MTNSKSSDFGTVILRTANTPIHGDQVGTTDRRSIGGENEPDPQHQVGDRATGRNRGGNGLVLVRERRPFLTATNTFLEDLKPYYLPGTIARLRRDLRTVELDLRALRTSGRVSTTNPQRLTESDVGQLLFYWRTRLSRYGRPLDRTSQRHLFSALGSLLGWSGNAVIDVM